MSRDNDTIKQLPPPDVPPDEEEEKEIDIESEWAVQTRRYCDCCKSRYQFQSHTD